MVNGQMVQEMLSQSILGYKFNRYKNKDMYNTYQKIGSFKIFLLIIKK